jgi:SNF2 family DNA or RNA helicase
MGRGPVADEPHLIVVPNSLTMQWTQELKTFFNPKQIEIHPLPITEAEVEAYFQSDEWVKSQTPMILRVVIASHSVRNMIETSVFLNSHL